MAKKLRKGTAADYKVRVRKQGKGTKGKGITIGKGRGAFVIRAGKFTGKGTGRRTGGGVG